MKDVERTLDTRPGVGGVPEMWSILFFFLMENCFVNKI
jgi:hypothetical protein